MSIRYAAGRRDTDGSPPPEPPSAASWLESGDLYHRSILIVDIEDSDSRSNDIKALHQAQLRKIVMGSIADTGITPDQYDRPTDTGDGLRVLFSPEVPKNRLAGPLMSALTNRLAGYNATAPDGAHMRLRDVLSAGEHAGTRTIFSAVRSTRPTGC